MPKGHAEITDQTLLSYIRTLSSPVTVKKISSKLEWNRGKVDGSINRLVSKEEVVVVKLSQSKGQRKRYIGLPSADYWNEFYTNFITSQGYILVGDNTNIFKNQTDKNKKGEISNYQVIIEDLSRKSEEKDNQIKILINRINEISSNLNPGLINVIFTHLDRIKKAAELKNISPEELLNNGISQIVDPSFDLATNIVSLVVQESISGTDPTKKDIAKEFIRRAQSFERE